jgi:membrane protease YdiL (CAAX protease family)
MPALILEFLAVFFVAILPQVLTSFYPDDMRERLNGLPGNWRFLAALPNRIGVIFLILYIAAGRRDAFHSIGLNLQADASFVPLLAAAFLTVYLLLIFVFANKRSAQRKQETAAIQQRTLLGMRYLGPMNSWQRFFTFVDLWLAVIGEELVYRGYLILLLGYETGSFTPWIIFSVALSVLVHLYQGRTWRLAISHAILAGLFILAMMFTKSLFAAIIPHLVYNTVWLIRALKANLQTPSLQEGTV